jgi:16S rRNA (guanine527-N7)-methyltransferase
MALNGGGDAQRGSTVADPAPAAAIDIFGPRLPLAETYVSLLVTDGVQHGLIGPREVPRIWHRHILNCAVVHPAIPHGALVVDIGTGAGLPGVVLSIARRDLSLVLVEPSQRRVDFLTMVAARLELTNVVVRRARAEELAAELTAEVVTARAVAPLERLAPWALPLLSPSGRLLALKGRSVRADLDRAVPVLRMMGATAWWVDEYGSGIVDPPTRVAVVEVGARVGQAVPRRQQKGRR